MDYHEAEEYLSTRTPGSDIIIRPSTKGDNHMSITWKVDDGVYHHLGNRQYHSDRCA
jgi:transcription elongation factor SPT6